MGGQRLPDLLDLGEAMVPPAQFQVGGAIAGPGIGGATSGTSCFETHSFISSGTWIHSSMTAFLCVSPTGIQKGFHRQTHPDIGRETSTKSQTDKPGANLGCANIKWYVIEILALAHCMPHNEDHIKVLMSQAHQVEWYLANDKSQTRNQQYVHCTSRYKGAGGKAKLVKLQVSQNESLPLMRQRAPRSPLDRSKRAQCIA